MPGQDDAGKTSKYCTKAFAKRFCRWSDWRDRMRASPDRASCQTECCNGPGHDDRQPVGSPSRIETIENTRCEPAARPTRRPSLKPTRGRVSRRVSGNQSRPARRCCREFRETRTRRRTRRPVSTARVFTLAWTIGSRRLANCEAAQILCAWRDLARRRASWAP